MLKSILNRRATALSGLVLVAVGVMFIHVGVIRPLKAARQHDDPAVAGNGDAVRVVPGEENVWVKSTVTEVHPALSWLEFVAYGLGGLISVIFGASIVISGLLGKLQLVSVKVRDDPEPWWW